MKSTLLFSTLLILFACNESPDIAKINGKSISQANLDDYIALRGGVDLPEKVSEQIKEEFINKISLAQAIQKKGLLNEKKINAELQEFHRELLITRYFENIFEKQITDEVVQQYYQDNPDEFTKRQVHYAHILLRINSQISKEDKAAKQAEANKIHSSLTQGESFKTLVEQFSEDFSTKNKTGDLGWLHESKLQPEFLENTRGLEVGEYSKPFETKFGFHIVKVLEQEKEIKQSFRLVKNAIKHKLKKTIKEQEVEALLSSAKLK